MTRPRHLLPVVIGLAALALTGCASGAGDSTTEPSAAPTAATDDLGGELTIFAAASLGGAFDELATEFEAAHPGLDVVPITYDGSSVLATQLIEGASADVFASADEKNMTKVVDAGLADEPVDFATNVLEIAVAPDNPLGIAGLDDLADGAATGADGGPITVVVCAPEVPCGNAAQTLIADAGITVTPASEEQNVTAVLTKVKAGEADAGLVYVTDVRAAGDAVAGVEIDDADAATNVYPLAALTDAPNPDAAAAFVEFVASEAGQQVLASFGFGAP
ncbi:molybdate ABC transporter substrate-binding protein [Agromyces endophyticus]|uniref:molybdate ABC transporter substrate-binding protein n=1 Tax=Agromyces sp. H17E-10 TaxID=2932244 RepID=UPI001FD21665|nr:molybdate ABC transporter substrate-binding protein [Agromyces sp. H17E-10]UOQ90049.1 molybdate ABC transporter substrate-binding protein [Agromyces sp. H17E-10]